MDVHRQQTEMFPGYAEWLSDAERGVHPVGCTDARLNGVRIQKTTLQPGGVGKHQQCVYRAGFATTQEAYDAAVKDVFNALDKVEAILSKSRYLTGDTITEADIRLFTTLVRFDMVYVGHFKCNKKRIVDYPNMWGYLRDLYQTSGVEETVDPEHIQKHYQQSHLNINPNGIVAIGPDLGFKKPHGRQ
ncbi:hypothetical protein OS493_013155 [Desmophyllum pertusum]|uniref:GST C-terminal domain-containing protein n=1 Tax=Desmophyllum pertusum TaxID=174260 RepID=A0A9W9YQ07_9CNID|nr:hypothetical protein OS493_013155 [Desmophyllum pertusum]